ncbi:MAG: hemolysin family protein [Rikenellaceae bacterium]
MTTTIILILLMLLLSAFFSGMEIAYLSKNRLKLEIDRKQNRMFDHIAEIFGRNPGQYITTILVGNNISLVVYSLSMSQLIRGALGGMQHLGTTGSLIVESAISTLIIIFVAEFLPKTIFRGNPNFYYKSLSPVIYFFYLLLYPVAKFTTMLSQGILRLVGSSTDQPESSHPFDKSDLASLIDSSSGDSSGGDGDNDNEIKLFQNALDFSDLRVRDCMTQRVDIEAVDIDSITIGDLAARFVKTKYSRIFVWRGSIDNIIGYVNSKSLFQSPQSVEEILRVVNFVPETMAVNSLMQSLIIHKTNIAVVIDEFGGTAGVISLEDILEQIFGEIEDEHDEPEMIEKVVSDDEYLFSGRLEVHYLNEKYDLKIEESDDFDTIAGFVIYNHEGIPAAGESLSIGRFEFKILRTASSRIELMRMKIIAEK